VSNSWTGDPPVSWSSPDPNIYKWWDYTQYYWHSISPQPEPPSNISHELINQVVSKIDQWALFWPFEEPEAQIVAVWLEPQRYIAVVSLKFAIASKDGKIGVVDSTLVRLGSYKKDEVKDEVKDENHVKETH
jgi:hypothetical protein